MSSQIEKFSGNNNICKTLEQIIKLFSTSLSSILFLQNSMHVRLKYLLSKCYAAFLKLKSQHNDVPLPPILLKMNLLSLQTIESSLNRAELS